MRVQSKRNEEGAPEHTVCAFISFPECQYQFMKKSLKKIRFYWRGWCVMRSTATLNPSGRFFPRGLMPKMHNKRSSSSEKDL